MQRDLMSGVGNLHAATMCMCVYLPIGGEGVKSVVARGGDSTTVGDGGDVEAVGGGDALMCCVG